MVIYGVKLRGCRQVLWMDGLDVACGNKKNANFEALGLCI